MVNDLLSVSWVAIRDIKKCVKVRFYKLSKCQTEIAGFFRSDKFQVFKIFQVAENPVQVYSTIDTIKLFQNFWISNNSNFENNTDTSNNATYQKIQTAQTFNLIKRVKHLDLLEKTSTSQLIHTFWTTETFPTSPTTFFQSSNFQMKWHCTKIWLLQIFSNK